MNSGEIIAANLRSFRGLRGMSQDDVAARMTALGHPTWSRATVSEIERGGREMKSLEQLSLASVFGVSPEEFWIERRPLVG